MTEKNQNQKKVCKCKNFKAAIESNTIKLIDYYQDEYYKTRKLKYGYYIVDHLQIAEYARDNHPAIPMNPIYYCPWCGGKLI